jgi:hypothetical protein
VWSYFYNKKEIRPGHQTYISANLPNRQFHDSLEGLRDEALDNDLVDRVAVLVHVSLRELLVQLLFSLDAEVPGCLLVRQSSRLSSKRTLQNNLLIKRIGRVSDPLSGDVQKDSTLSDGLVEDVLTNDVGTVRIREAVRRQRNRKPRRHLRHVPPLVS